MAEIYGAELALAKDYEFFGGAKLAIYTWHGCDLAIKGQCKVAYTASETPMSIYLNVHTALESLRRSCSTNSPSNTNTDIRSHGPRTIVVGPTDSGKTTLCRILLSYAHKMGHQPLYIDLDPREVRTDDHVC
jgi:polyribonucleotide 5'-hydroxyl-kinase